MITLINMIKPEFKYSAITEAIIGAAMKVHQKMRNGYPEVIYNRCLRIEFERCSLSFKNEIELPVFYESVEVGRRRFDFLVEDKVIVEIKVVAELNNAHLAQALNYLECLNLKIELLLNFGSKSLEIKRLINNKVN